MEPFPPKRYNPGHLGGIASSNKLTAQQRSERARRGGIALTATYGQGYFAALGRLHTTRRLDREKDQTEN